MDKGHTHTYTYTHILSISISGSLFHMCLFPCLLSHSAVSKHSYFALPLHKLQHLPPDGQSLCVCVCESWLLWRHEQMEHREPVGGSIPAAANRIMICSQCYPWERDRWLIGVSISRCVQLRVTTLVMQLNVRSSFPTSLREVLRVVTSESAAR